MRKVTFKIESANRYNLIHEIFVFSADWLKLAVCWSDRRKKKQENNIRKNAYMKKLFISKEINQEEGIMR